MLKEFNLSGKRNVTWVERSDSDKKSEFTYFEQDVKEFIRLLNKNEDVIDYIKDWMNNYKEENKEYPSYLAIVLKVIELMELKINELAGDKLNGRI